MAKSELIMRALRAALMAGADDAPASIQKAPIIGYHASPHDFSQFDLRKIGTGEGSQAFSHGLYFGGDEGTALGYREMFGGPAAAHMYQANLDVDPATLIDWDKPIAAQSPLIQNAASDLYQMPKSKLMQGQYLRPVGADETAKLNDMGIPGLTYKEGRFFGSGDSQNYVMYNDKLIDILKKYAIPGVAGGGGAAVAAPKGYADPISATPK